MDICFEMLRFERGAIGLRVVNGRGVDWPVVRNLRGEGGELTVSRSVLGRAMDHGERAVIADAGGEAIDPTVSMVQHGICSAMCVPLRNEDEILGVIYGDRTTTGAIYTPEDVDFLAAIAVQVSIGLINARLMAEQKAKLEMEAELDVAREIQQQLFPRSLPERDDVAFAVLNDPGRRVSGDYYDVIEMDDGRIGFVIADVTGEGVAASLLMSNLQGVVRWTMRSCEDLGVLCGQWNQLLCDNTDASKFVTCLTGIIDTAKRDLTYVLAGHPPPYMVREATGEVDTLSAEAHYPLGIVDGAIYETTTVRIGEGRCTLVGFTDGVYEAASATGEQFGDERIVKVLSECAKLEPQAMIRRLRKAVATHCRDMPQGDDITMLAARFA
jgi:phosphoserine phosphatase RsbU/P